MSPFQQNEKTRPIVAKPESSILHFPANFPPLLAHLGSLDPPPSGPPQWRPPQWRPFSDESSGWAGMSHKPQTWLDLGINSEHGGTHVWICYMLARMKSKKHERIWPFYLWRRIGSWIRGWGPCQGTGSQRSSWEPQIQWQHSVETRISFLENNLYHK